MIPVRSEMYRQSCEEISGQLQIGQPPLTLMLLEWRVLLEITRESSIVDSTEDKADCPE